jgi:malonyl CoA-acyl carrier protein transacylase
VAALFILEPIAAHMLNLSQQDGKVQLVNEERPDQLVVAGRPQIEQRLELMLQRGVPDGQLASPGKEPFSLHTMLLTQTQYPLPQASANPGPC